MIIINYDMIITSDKSNVNNTNKLTLTIGKGFFILNFSFFLFFWVDEYVFLNFSYSLQINTVQLNTNIYLIDNVHI